MADLSDGETTEMQGSGAKPYVLKNTGGVYSCSCPAWRNQSTPIERRTCKHLRKLRGDAAEKERLGGELAAPAKPSAAKEDAPPVLLAQSWDNSADLTGWWISEKLDGVRAYWDGKCFLSRLGNVYHAPDWFVEGFPDEPLDGELWIDRKAFQRTVSIVRRQDKSDHWKDVRYVVFDAPNHGGEFEARVKHLKKLVKATKLKHVDALDHSPCKGTPHLKEELARIEGLGGEGLMLREPKSVYVAGRSWTLLKVKSFHDAEAIVVAYVPGKGKHKGRMGALNVQLSDGTDFSVGTGFSDKQRDNPPEVGSVIMFRYQEMTDGGVPRFPSFVRAVTGEKAAAIQADLGKEPAVKKSAKKKPAGKAAKKTVAEKSPTVKSSGKTSAVASSRSATTPGDKQYFELVDGKSAKFWEIVRSGTEVTVRYGRIGADGTSKLKDLVTEDAAVAHVEKLIGQKTAKGYEQA